MKYIKVTLDNLNIKPNSEIKGYITVDYPGRYDGVVINTQIILTNSKLSNNNEIHQSYVRQSEHKAQL